MSGRKDILSTFLTPTGAASAPTSFSLTTSFNSPPTVVKYLDNCSYGINVTTTDSDGTFQIQASNDYRESPVGGADVNPGTWVPLELAGGTPTVAAEDTNILISLNQIPFYALRVAYISTTPGTGTCTISIVDKMV